MSQEVIFVPLNAFSGIDAQSVEATTTSPVNAEQPLKLKACIVVGSIGLRLFNPVALFIYSFVTGDCERSRLMIVVPANALPDATSFNLGSICGLSNVNSLQPLKAPFAMVSRFSMCGFPTADLQEYINVSGAFTALTRFGQFVKAVQL